MTQDDLTRLAYELLMNWWSARSVTVHDGPVAYARAEDHKRSGGFSLHLDVAEANRIVNGD